MHIYINEQTHEYPILEGDIRIKYPNIPEESTGDSFPCPEGFAKVVWVSPPSYNEIEQHLVSLPPECVDGIWHPRWEVKENSLDLKIQLNNQVVSVENEIIKMELAACEASLKNASEELKVHWEAHQAAMIAYSQQYPRVGTRPTLPPVLLMPELNNSGSAPNVIE